MRKEVKTMFPTFHFNIERWKYNPTFELYVSTKGRIRNKSKADIAPKVTHGGYLSVYVHGSLNKYMLLHRVVMLTWRPIANADEMTVDHLDHNKRNNRLSNLEWVPGYENLIRAQADEVVKTKKMEEEIQAETQTKKMKDFWLLVNGNRFESVETATPYVKNTMPYLDALSMTEDKVKKVFKTLVNAYNNKVPLYIENGFVKEKYNCKFSIVLKGE
jgi:hypothetical protein